MKNELRFDTCSIKTKNFLSTNISNKARNNKVIKSKGHKIDGQIRCTGGIIKGLAGSFPTTYMLKNSLICTILDRCRYNVYLFLNAFKIQYYPATKKLLKLYIRLLRNKFDWENYAFQALHNTKN